MINYQNGKNFATIGFGLSLLAVMANVAIDLFGYIMGGLGSFVVDLWKIVSIVSFLAICLTAGGFGIMWLSKHEMLDLAAAGLLGINLLYGLFYDRMYSFCPYFILNLISCALSAALYLVLALRVKDKNKMLFLLLGCAVLFRIAVTAYNMFMPGLLPYMFVYLVVSAGNIVCAGLCVLATRQD